MDKFRITREIGIDAAHRVPDHGSKCRCLHGHRYTIQATCEGPLAEIGAEAGMVLDFGFLKEEMMGVIDAWCDHATILFADDPLLACFHIPGSIVNGMIGDTYRLGWSALSRDSMVLPLKLYVLPVVPTAENLARHWFERLKPRVLDRSEGRATLARLRVYETPNCWGDYPA